MDARWSPRRRSGRSPAHLVHEGLRPVVTFEAPDEIGSCGAGCPRRLQGCLDPFQQGQPGFDPGTREVMRAAVSLEAQDALGEGRTPLRIA